MSDVERLGIEGLILKLRDVALNRSKSLRLGMEVAFPILLGLVYIATLFLCGEP